LSRSRTEKRADIAFALVLLVIGIGAAIEGMKIPPSRFDPLGSGAVPALMGAALAILALVVLFAAVTSFKIGDGDRLFTGLDETSGEVPSLARAAGAFAWTLVYAAALEFRVVPYWASTFVYMAGLILALAPRDKRAYATTAIVSGICAIGLDFVFRNVLSIDLP